MKDSTTSTSQGQSVLTEVAITVLEPMHHRGWLHKCRKQQLKAALVDRFFLLGYGMQGENERKPINCLMALIMETDIV